MGFTIIGIIGGALCSWLLTYLYYWKSKKDIEKTNPFPLLMELKCEVSKINLFIQNLSEKSKINMEIYKSVKRIFTIITVLEEYYSKYMMIYYWISAKLGRAIKRHDEEQIKIEYSNLNDIALRFSEDILSQITLLEKERSNKK
jgi:hypothetical protein